MFRTLYSRLAAVLLALFALVGVVSVVATLHFFELYNEESNQRLNQPLARHLADQMLLFSLADANPERLRSMFDMQMIVNPSIQIYLLDAGGRIVAYSASPGEVKLERVDLAPVHCIPGPQRRTFRSAATIRAIPGSAASSRPRRIGPGERRAGLLVRLLGRRASGRARGAAARRATSSRWLQGSRG